MSRDTSETLCAVLYKTNLQMFLDAIQAKPSSELVSFWHDMVLAIRRYARPSDGMALGVVLLWEDIVYKVFQFLVRPTDNASHNGPGGIHRVFAEVSMSTSDGAVSC